MTEDIAVATTPDMGALAEQVRRVAALRRNVAALDAVLFERRRAFEDGVADLNAQKGAANAETNAAEQVVRALALAHYHATQDKAPTPGVSVKLYEELGYDDAEAFAWAKEKQMALVPESLIPESLNRKAFEKIARATPLDFVNFIVEARVQIATDLEKALGGRA